MFIFFLRKRSWSACSGVSELLWALMISPAVEKTLSAATLVPGIHKCIWDSLERRGRGHVAEISTTTVDLQ